jgi:hypothetical protein
MDLFNTQSNKRTLETKKCKYCKRMVFTQSDIPICSRKSCIKMRGKLK